MNKNRIFKSLTFFFIALLTGINVSGQLAINTAMTPAQLVQNVLISGGLPVSNVTFTGTTGATTSQFGSFTNGNTTNLGLTAGVVMATGYVNHIPAVASTSGGMSDQTGSGSDADLASLTGGSAGTNDACVLQFDFVPTANTVSFRYVFASEEYPDYVCSTFNDVFGFFLSGPGISGTFSNSAVNIALIPSTTYPVAINTVNSGTPGSASSGACPSYGLSYSSDYVDNSSGTTIVFGGFTKVLTATHSVTPCQTYHIKLAIADVGDEIYDSGVFLEANSFSAGGAIVHTGYSNSTMGNHAIVNCTNGYFGFILPSPATSPVTINYTIGGTATNGVNYTTIPSSVTIPTGQDSAGVIIHPVSGTGTQTVIIGVTNGCSTSYDTIYIMANPALTVNATGTTTICPGGSTTLSALASGGQTITPYTYSWSNGSNGTPITVTPAGTTTYIVTATDYCSQTATASAIVTVANNLTVSVAPTNPTICPSSSVTLTASGGAASYTWAPPTGLSVTTGSSVIASPPTNQTYTVTGASGGCTGSATVTVNVVNNLLVTATPTNPTICPSSSVTLTASGGATSYTWAPSTGLSVTTGSSVIASPPATQTYTVTGASGGCTGSATVTVNVVNNLVVTATPANSTICPGGNVALTANGATNYIWSPAAGLSASSGTTVTASPTTNTIYTVTGSSGTCSGTTSVTVNLGPSPTITVNPAAPSICNGTSTLLTASGASTYAWSGGLGIANPVTATPATTTTYNVTGTDVNGCTGATNITVTVNPKPIVSITASANPICIGAPSILTANGAATYSWSGGFGTANPLTVMPTSTTTYTTTGTDANGCTGTASITVTVSPPPIAQISPFTPSTCGLNNGSATATGGSGYLWNNGQITPTISGLASGNYTVTVTNVAGCSSTATVTINNNPGPTITATSMDENCGHANGTASSTPNGGVTPYHYLWSNSQTTQNISNLPAGIYTVTLTDANSCTASVSVTVNNIAGPSLQVVNFVNETCSYGNGSATVNAVNGAPPYSYLWSNGNGSATASNLHGGTYTITVTDANNCTAINTVTLTNSPGPTLNVTGINMASCGMSDGSCTLTVNSGTQPYSYNWNSNPPQSTQSLINVPSGIYIVTVTDANGCTNSISATIGQKPGPSATAISQNEICGQLNGSANVNATGGLGTYTYLWSNGQTNSTATGLAQGVYTVTVSDGGCSTAITVNVMETPGPTAGFSAHPTTLTIMDGPVTFTDNSSGNVVNWQWIYGDNSANGSGASNTHPYPIIGTYLVTLIVTDNNGCLDTISDTIKVKDIFTFYIPNSFTPNGDGWNDVFCPKGVSVDPNNFEMSIFDRWGNLFFHTTKWLTDHSEAWNGTKDNSGNFNDVVMDVYVYRIRLREANDGPKHEYIGRISLIP
jgi:gliding motility-associated-like protein